MVRVAPLSHFSTSALGNASNAMETMSDRSDSRRGSESPEFSQQGNAENIPSGFILKLYQMVNGAPDEIISWTSSGDAFIIGSDLQRLESETLPQYFRHSRFQSLVRQLNFYSFRKINKERNVWIYKHHLFHRDRPEDLRLVRRRTCPGLDGRKQRFSRFSCRKVKPEDNENESTDDSSAEESSEEDMPQESLKKRDSLEALEQPMGKRFRRQDSVTLDDPKKAHVFREVDTSMLLPDNAQLTCAPHVHVGSKAKNDRIEMVQQSMIINEVAMKLDEYARKAMKGKGNNRKGPGATPALFGCLPNFSSPLGSLLTYDDEFEYDSDQHGRGERSSSSSLGVVTESDESLTSDDLSISGEPSDLASLSQEQPPVDDCAVIDNIYQHLVEASESIGLHSASVASFCMSTAPAGDKQLCEKIADLISKSELLSSEFHLYRSALNPSDQVGVFAPANLNARSPASTNKDQRLDSSRNETVREFTTFAINCLQRILAEHAQGNLCVLSDDALTVLEYTASVWQKSVGTAYR